MANQYGTEIFFKVFRVVGNGHVEDHQRFYGLVWIQNFDIRQNYCKFAKGNPRKEDPNERSKLYGVHGRYFVPLFPRLISLSLLF